MRKNALMLLGVTTALAAMTMIGCGSSEADTQQTSNGATGEEIVYTTYGQPDDWANWQGIFEEFCGQNNITRIDTDMSSAEEIEKFNAEKDNPQADSAEVGMIWGPVAVDQGVTMAYKNANWDKIPD